MAAGPVEGNPRDELIALALRQIELKHPTHFSSATPQVEATLSAAPSPVPAIVDEVDRVLVRPARRNMFKPQPQTLNKPPEGLAERVAHIQAEAAAREKAAKEKAQRIAREAQEAKLQEEREKTERLEGERVKKEAAVTIQLSPLLKVIGAREQLAVVRDTIWFGGTLDPKPTVERNLMFPPDYSRNKYIEVDCLSFTLRYPYQTAAWYGGDWVTTGIDGEGGHSTPVYWRKEDREASLRIVVRRDPEPSFSVFGVNSFGSLSTVVQEENRIILEDPILSQKKLFEMLAKICSQSPNPRDLQREGAQSITDSLYQPPLPRGRSFLEILWGNLTK